MHVHKHIQRFSKGYCKNGWFHLLTCSWFLTYIQAATDEGLIIISPWWPGVMKVFWMVLDRIWDPYPTHRCRYGNVSAEGCIQQPLITSKIYFHFFGAASTTDFWKKVPEIFDRNIIWKIFWNFTKTENLSRISEICLTFLMVRFSPSLRPWLSWSKTDLVVCVNRPWHNFPSSKFA